MEGDRLTPEKLRALADAPRTPFWEGNARQALKWAADLVEAAEAVIAEQRHTPRQGAVHDAG